MINTLNAEWIKLRTVVAHWVLVVIAVAFPLTITTLVAIFGEVDFGLDADEVSGLISGLTVVSAMLLGAMAAISLTSEYGHNTIRPTYAATPHRLRVIAAKLVTNTSVVTLLSVAVVFVCWMVASTILSSRDASVSIGDDGVLASLISVCALAVIVSWFAFGLALIIRNSPATVTLLLLWPLLVENLIALLFTLIGWEGATRWLPYSAGITATVAESEPDVLGRPGGLLYFAAVSLALVVLGAVLDQRRDA